MKRIAIIGAALLASGGAAFAQPDPNAGAPAPDGNGGGSGAAPAAGDMGPVFSAGGPIIDRALTLAKDGYGLYGDFDVLRVSASGGGVTVTATAEGLHFGGGYGITDKVTIGAEYSFSLNSFEIKGPLTLYGAMSLMHTDKLDIGASADLIINLDSTSTDAMGMVTSSTSETLQGGVAVRYKLTPQVALYTGTPLAPGPLGQQLSIGFQSGAPITLGIPVGVALQPTPQIYAFAGTEIASLSLSNSSNVFLFKDFIPLDLGAYYTASKNLDVGAFLDFIDLENNSGVFVFGIGARYYK